MPSPLGVAIRYNDAVIEGLSCPLLLWVLWLVVSGLGKRVRGIPHHPSDRRLRVVTRLVRFAILSIHP